MLGLRLAATNAHTLGFGPTTSTSWCAASATAHRPPHAPLLRGQSTAGPGQCACGPKLWGGRGRPGTVPLNRGETPCSARYLRPIYCLQAGSTVQKPGKLVAE
ncbi:hypothetical protein AAFF_G00382060 [Aldrovandia affinis]|uniref:Uncharacterized protein n=1 Tax=Aldrovandia affinis TaxID=143900 RepID=A0AAD7T865_9TELE|nr:hypothetical protein AAFF_G00382060 [Aldrovandia affinis]